MTNRTKIQILAVVAALAAAGLGALSLERGTDETELEAQPPPPSCVYAPPHTGPEVAVSCYSGYCVVCARSRCLRFDPSTCEELP